MEDLVCQQNVEIWDTLLLCILDAACVKDNPYELTRAMHSFDKVCIEAEDSHFEHLLVIQQ
jgi:hypothetical protein